MNKRYYIAPKAHCFAFFSETFLAHSITVDSSQSTKVYKENQALTQKRDDDLGIWND